MKDDKIKILIVEDEAIVAMDLAATLTKEGYFITGIADNAAEAEEIFSNNEADIVLADINIIGDTDGIALVEKLMDIRECPVIYITALSDAETISRMKRTRPSAYLTKPYNMQNLGIAIELALSNFATLRGPADNKMQKEAMHVVKEPETNNLAGGADKEQILLLKDLLFIKQGYRFVKVMHRDILFAEADNNHVHIVTADKKYTVRMSLQQLEERINYDHMVRVHRSYLVNLTAINTFTDAEIQIGKFTIPIGRNYREKFILQFNLR